MQIGNSDLARVIVSRIVEAAEKLKAKTVISPECGHDYTALRWEGANLIGRPFTFKVQHIIEVLGEFQEQGLLNPQLPAIAVLYTLYARACDPVLEFLQMGGQHTDAQIADLVLSTCFDGLNARSSP